ncbi:Ig-like domain-containing protein [Lysinibacillus sp. FSL K6-3209]|uniref:Ig-like domain-containing protein n=1 Tax=Lysinibacillus sp. FSL K6-3209 TaxID=2921497 RepID=UPI0030DB4791
MVNIFKKGFIYSALMLLLLVSFSVESASAAEGVDYEEGVTNLNNTPENSAIIGSQLKKPEKGWNRYDGNSPKVIVGDTSKYTPHNHPIFYKGSTAFFTRDNTATFRFNGTKIRLLSAIWVARSKSIEVSIDGQIVDTFSQNIDSLNINDGQRVSYEKNNLSPGTHIVILKNLDTASFFELDAIDVDGTLLSPVEIPDVEFISLDKNSIEILEGSKDKLTATVLPENSINKNVIWSSSDESIATVDQDGNVTAIREGQAIITAKIENTDISATSTVIVKKPISESSSAILSITLVNGITKEYDVTNTVLNNYLNWFESAQGTSTFKFTKTISPYKKVTEYIVHDKIASFEVREY